MLHGDISNQRGFVIGVRCEDFLLEFKDKKLIDKFKNLFKGKAHNAEVNQEVLSLMNYIYWDTEMTVSLIVDKENYTEELQEFLSNFPFNQVGVVLSSISEITMMLNTGQLTYYVDNNQKRLLDVNSAYAVKLDDFNIIMKRRVKRFEEDKTV